MGLLLYRLLIAACMTLSAGLLHAQDLQPVPPLSGRLIDQTGTLTAPQRAALSAKLAAIDQQQGAQVVILLVDTTLPEDIAAYAQRVGEAWKIGRRKVGDGLLVVVAKRDRKIRIEVAKALEGAVPDLAASHIIQDQLTPAFKAGDFAGGLNAAIDSLAKRIAAEGLPAPGPAASASFPDLSIPDSLPPLGGTEFPGTAPAPAPRPAPTSDKGPDFGAWAIILFFTVPIAGAVLTSIMGRKLGALGTGGLMAGLGFWLTSSIVAACIAGVLALVLVSMFRAGTRRGGMSDALSTLGSVLASSSSSGSSGGWSMGGGGFSSGGGGDFGGGGASGEW